MFLILIFAVFICSLVLGLLFSPFFYWATYSRLWRCVLFEKGSLNAKRKQAGFLALAILRAPLWTACWYLDELLFPQYRQSEIKPVFIIGQPRCGTTFLHRTMALDGANFFAVRHLEWRYPFICVQKLIRYFGLEKKLGETSYWSKSDAGELAARMHSNRLIDWEEDGIFFEENFLHHFFIYLRFPYSRLLPDLDTFPTLPKQAQQKMLIAHRRTLQKVVYLHGAQNRIYLSKEVTSHNKIPALLRLYPEARFLVVARESSHFMPSLMALVRMSTWSKTGNDPLLLPHWHDSFVARMRDDSRHLVDICDQIIPADRQLRVGAEHVIKRPSATIMMIYRELSLSMSDEVVAGLMALDRRQATRDRGYHYEPFSPAGFEKYDAFVKTNNCLFKRKIESQLQGVDE